MNKFSIEVPNSKASSYKIVTVIILLMNVLVFAWLSAAGEAGSLKSLCVIGLALNILALTVFFLKNRVPVFHSFRPEITFVINAVIWILVGKWLLAVLLIVFAVMGLYTNRKPVIVFSEEGILYPSFPPKKITWEEVAAVILKDDFLTIDLKNNQLFQFSLTSEVAADIDAAKFNNSCTEKIRNKE